MKIETEIKLDFSDVLIRPKRTSINSRSDVNLSRSMKFKYSPFKWNGIPIIAANMDTVGTFEIYNVLKQHKIITAMHKFYTLSDFKNAHEKYGLDPDYFMVSTGMGENAINYLKEILSEIDCKWICIDIANGYIQNFVAFCRKVRENFPDKIIVAGNVVSREMTEELILNGMVDIVKVGIGPGSACTTRIKTGVGMPQLSAVIECADAAHGVDGHIISDGGITCPGDVSKAFGAGGDFVMIGGQFAGHDENPGDIIEENGQKYKLFYGMSSETAMNTHYGKVASYRSSEGRTVKLKYKGAINDTILDFLGGIRSTCTYINAKKIKNIPKCCTFVRVNRQLNTIYA